MTDIDDETVRGVVDRARAGDRGALADAIREASADERSRAAKELVGDRSAYEALHDALRELGISR